MYSHLFDQEIPCFQETIKVPYRVHKTIMSQFNTVHIFTTYFSRIDGSGRPAALRAMSVCYDLLCVSIFLHPF
jgi:hypothetical protein